MYFQDESEKKLEEIKELREKMKEVSTESRNKDELQKQLVSEYERMSKDVNRSAYTKRIMEIVGNIKKQKQEIDKVSIVDTESSGHLCFRNIILYQNTKNSSTGFSLSSNINEVFISRYMMLNQYQNIRYMLFND